MLLRDALAQLDRTDVRIEPLRGNLDTRLRKLDAGQFDAIVLAAAGLKRLGLAHRIRHAFEPARMLPAAGQGALGIEVMAHRRDLLQALAPLAHLPSWLATTAERAVSRAMGGSCSMPLAAHANWRGDLLQLEAAWGQEQEVPWVGSKALLVRAAVGAAVVSHDQARALGEEVARRLCQGGATRSEVGV